MVLIISFNIFSTDEGAGSKIGGMIIVMFGLFVGVIAVIGGRNHPAVGGTFFVLAIVVVVLAGGDVLALVFNTSNPAVSIQNTTTYVDPPSSVDSPELHDYEQKKFGISQPWIANTFTGYYLILAFGFGLYQLIAIRIRKSRRNLAIPLEVVEFLSGAYFLIVVATAPNRLDSLTAAAETRAIWWGFAGLFVWSVVMQIVLWVRGNARNTGQAMVNSGGFGVFLGIGLIIFSYPLAGGIFHLVGYDFFRIAAMMADVTNTSITVERWNELFIIGQFTGMFVPTIFKDIIVWANAMILGRMIG